MQAQAPETAVAEVARTLRAFARTARARQLYNSNNRAYLRMRSELAASMEALLQRTAVLTLRVRPDRLLYEDETVLEEPQHNDSIPFALYRDGLRRIDFSRGMTENELEALLAATAGGFAYSGLGDDIVSLLWKHDLDNIRYLVVDTSFVEAVGESSSAATNASFEDVDAQIDGLLQAIYGSSADDVGPRAVHLDASDFGAIQIAEALDAIDEMTPGLHPARRLPDAPVYSAELLEQARREDADRVTARAANAALRALHQLDGFDADNAADGLLRMFDAAVMANDLPLATRLVAGVRSAPGNHPRAAAWLDEAVSEARIRHAVGSATEPGTPKATFVRLFQFLQSCGPRIVPLILPLLNQFDDAVRRRALTDLVADLGGADFDQLRTMLDDGSTAIVQEGLHLLSRSTRRDAAAFWRSVEQHRNPLARILLLETLSTQQGSAGLNSATRLLRDPEVRVRLAAVECLLNTRHPDAAQVLASVVEHPAFEDEDAEVKRSLLRAYAKTNGSRALHLLFRAIKKGESRLARRETEDLAVHAVLATAVVQDRRADSVLTKAAESKNRRIRDTALQTLKHRSPTS